MLIEFKVRGPKVQYSMNINMNYKVNIIRGYSATGKTSMYNCIDAANKRITGCSITCNLECVAARNLYELNNTKGAVIFIDENIWENMLNEAGNKNNMKEIIEKSSNYFVIITRDICDWIRVDVNAIYEIRRRGTVGRTL